MLHIIFQKVVNFSKACALFLEMFHYLSISKKDLIKPKLWQTPEYVFN